MESELKTLRSLHTARGVCIWFHLISSSLSVRAYKNLNSLLSRGRSSTQNWCLSPCFQGDTRVASNTSASNHQPPAATASLLIHTPWTITLSGDLSQIVEKHTQLPCTTPHAQRRRRRMGRATQGKCFRDWGINLATGNHAGTKGNTLWQEQGSLD